MHACQCINVCVRACVYVRMCVREYVSAYVHFHNNWGATNLDKNKIIYLIQTTAQFRDI